MTSSATPKGKPVEVSGDLIQAGITNDYETSIAASLSELKALHDRGLVTTEEYQDRRRELLLSGRWD